MAKVKIIGQNARRILFVTPLLLVPLAAVLLVMRRPIGNYSDSAGPQFEGAYADEVGNFDGHLRVVTWNMHYADNVELDIATLEGASELRDPDILLLQEIDAEGVETFAKTLHYNYIYYPAVFARQRLKEYGNAILAKWPLSNPQKVVLPNALPGWLESRNSARATISLNGKEIIVYSVHMELTWMVLFKPGDSEAEFLRRDAGSYNNFTIIGGDFNTWSPASITVLEQQMSKIGLTRLTKGTGYTFESSGLKLTLDHIFSKAVLDYQAGVYRQTNVSDHYPLWAEMTIGNHP